MIYKILKHAEWQMALQAGAFTGSAVDLQDGFIHLSAATQVVETAARYFAGQEDLMLLAVDEAKLGDALKWEPSRGGALFPHYYGSLPASAVVKAIPLPWDGSRHVFPQGLA